MTATINVFLMYTNEDGTYLLQLLRHLDAINRVSKTHFWYDDPIYPDEEWSPQIVSRFEDADVYLLLLSNNFMHSKFIEQVEFKMIIDKYKAGKSKVIPIVLENCPWDVDFEAEEYTFNFNQLHVLPDVGKPVADWPSDDSAFETSAEYVTKVIDSLSPLGFRKVAKQDSPAGSIEKEDQLALSFSEEKEAEEKAREELRITEAAVAREKALEIEKERRLEEAEEIRVKIKEENRRNAEIENQRKIQEEEWLIERMETNPEIKLVNTAEPVRLQDTSEEKPLPEDGFGSRKRIFLALGSAAAIIALIFLLYSRGDDGNANELTQQPESESVVAKSADNEEKILEEKSSSSTTLGSGASLSKLSVGQPYQNGIVFEVDKKGKKIVIAFTEDLGPMTWKEAMAVHEQLGEGWRLPTLTELSALYKTIGPGADNLGAFTNELYWSATPYDSNQARLVRFSDGNTTFHYNSKGNFRKFLVRAVRDVE